MKLKYISFSWQKQSILLKSTFCRKNGNLVVSPPKLRPKSSKIAQILGALNQAHSYQTAYGELSTFSQREPFPKEKRKKVKIHGFTFSSWFSPFFVRINIWMPFFLQRKHGTFSFQKCLRTVEKTAYKLRSMGIVRNKSYAVKCS